MSRLLLGVLLGVVLGTSAAQAEQGEWQLGAQPAYVLAYADGQAASGVGGLVHAAHAPSDSVRLQLLGAVAAHPGGSMSWLAAAGVAYVLDVVRIVPFFECNLGLLGTLQPTDRVRLALGLGVGFGGDYLISRRLSVGLAVRWAAALTDLQGLPLYVVIGPRLTARFGL
ncbi:MAG: hypothetical protein RMK29_00215 [Myxococcales bacterium]|nr:hypothetical protein [Myxococcota bacterium]MDW8280099.1 hypothetical protein [Myxococcales bacterium]